METQNFSSTDNGKTVAILSYITIVGWLVAYFAMHKDNKTELGSYHLRQTLLLFICAVVLGWGVGFVIGLLIVATNIGALIYLAYIIQLGIFILWIIGLIGAINGEKKPIPFIGEKAQSMFSSI